jgi:cell division protein FtsW (lipid II flippase)
MRREETREEAKRHGAAMLVGPAIGAVIGIVIVAIIAIITSSSSWWWWVAAALAGAVGGFAIAPITAAAKEDGVTNDAHVATHGRGDADAPVEGAEQADVVERHQPTAPSRR